MKKNTPPKTSSRSIVGRITRNAKGKKIVFVSGNFNILHPGHLRLLRFAKECGEYLVVGVNDAKSPGTLLPENVRLEGVQAISWADFAFILHENPEAFISKLKPAIVVKGSEHEGKSNPEAAAVAEYGGKILFSSGDMFFSSVDLLRKDWAEVNLSTIKKPRDFVARHNLKTANLSQLIQNYNGLGVCVIGDLIVDEYITCDALGMSQEDPTIVVMPVLNEKFLGGAAIVAAHAKGLGATVNFFSVCGNDATADFAQNELAANRVTSHLYVDGSRPTTLKQRFRTGQKTLLRVSHLRQHDINSELRSKILKNIKKVLEKTDLLIFADFNYGCLPQSLVDEIVFEADRRGVAIAADSQSSSQMGDVSRFKNALLITPTEREARLATRDFDSGLVVLAEKLRQSSNCANIIMTLAAEGILIHAGNDAKSQWITDKLPALNVAPKDVAGAGDSLFICAAMTLAAGGDIWQASYLGSLAAACQVGRIGNKPLSTEELYQEIRL